MPILTYFTIFVLIALFLVLRTFVVVPMREAVVVERLGRFRVVLQPGFHFLIPFADRIAYRHETREQVIDIPSQACITRDNIQVEVDGLVYLQVLDPNQASYGIEDYRRAGINLAQTTMRAEIGKLTLGQSFYERESLNETIVQEIDKASNPWGIKVLRYELRNITPSANVVHTLEKQMECGAGKNAPRSPGLRRRRRRRSTSPRGSVRRRSTSPRGRCSAGSTSPRDGPRPSPSSPTPPPRAPSGSAASVQKEGGAAALKMQLVEEYIETISEIAAKSNVSVVPLELARIKGFFEGISDVADGVPPQKERGGDMSTVFELFNLAVWGILFLVLIVKFLRSIRLVPTQSAYIVERARQLLKDTEPRVPRPGSLRRQGRLHLRPQGGDGGRSTPGVFHARRGSGRGGRRPLHLRHRSGKGELRRDGLLLRRHATGADDDALRDRHARARPHLRGARPDLGKGRGGAGKSG